jgi:hypothetical protein
MSVQGAARSNGAEIVVESCTGASSQRFVQTVGYHLKPMHDESYCVDVAGGALAEGAKVHLWQCNGSATQRWKVNSYTGEFRNLATDGNGNQYCLQKNETAFTVGRCAKEKSDQWLLFNAPTYPGFTSRSVEVRVALETLDLISDQFDVIDAELELAKTSYDNLISSHGEHDAAVSSQVNSFNDEVLRIEIETALYTNNKQALAYFQLPSAEGGLQELVSQIVQKAMKDNLSAGLPVAEHEIKNLIAIADNQKDFGKAFDRYAEAYHMIVMQESE